MTVRPAARKLAMASSSTSMPLTGRNSPMNTKSVASALAMIGLNSACETPLWTTRTSPRGLPILLRNMSAL